jgi:hypothetical protein
LPILSQVPSGSRWIRAEFFPERVNTKQAKPANAMIKTSDPIIFVLLSMVLRLGIEPVQGSAREE